MSIRAHIIRRAVLGLSAALTAQPAWTDNKAVERSFLERSAITSADKSCDLFSDGERLALKSGLYQAEGELLRANYRRSELDRLAAEVASHTRALGCDHPNVAEVAATIRSSYRQFAKTTYLEYPSAHGVWGASRSVHDAWAASQQPAANGTQAGLRRSASSEDMRFAVAIPATGPMPITAKILLRDPAKLATPWLGSALRSTGELTAPPRSVTRTEWAGERKLERTVTGDPIQVFYFPVATLARLEALDPREAITIEVAPSPRAKDQTPITATFEIGDFRAARAFVMIPAPEYPAQASATAASGAH
jgi:hypothetical protein